MEYKIEFLPLTAIKPYEKNAKKHNDTQIEHIANSIKQFGFKQNLVIDKDNVLIAGHGRYEAAKVLGLDSVPCLRAEDLTEEQVKAYRLADNKTAESDWDFGLLDSELESIQTVDMSDFGFIDEQTDGYIENFFDEPSEPAGGNGNDNVKIIITCTPEQKDEVEQVLKDHEFIYEVK